jgi:hypothetical protein
LEKTRFTIEQIFLTDDRGKAAAQPCGVKYYVVDATGVESALNDFLVAQSATLVGPMQTFPGLQAIATARSKEAVFTIHITPGSDSRRAFPRGARDEDRP